ncbi:MAG TPA: energy transducer TonB [Bryobacteraceae bacterium]|nr:energy transducer TonB [Bryobacteraceae bacterium]
MFDQTFVNSQASARRPWTVAGSLVLQTALIAVVLIIPLLHTASLDLPVKLPVWFPLEKVNLRLKPEAVKAAANRSSSAPRPEFHLALTAPIQVPRRIDLTPDAPELTVADALIGTAGPSLGSLLPGIAVQQPSAPTSVTARPKPVPPSPPVRIGGGVQSAKLIFGPKPAYPRIALTTRTQGVVKIQALIGRDGVIRNLQAVSGPALLIAAAMDAVRQWRYRPTLLNGEPVEVITEIDVNFTLGQ